jgi:hypothetical protein
VEGSGALERVPLSCIAGNVRGLAGACRATSSLVLSFATPSSVVRRLRWNRSQGDEGGALGQLTPVVNATRHARARLRCTTQSGDRELRQRLGSGLNLLRAPIGEKRGRQTQSTPAAGGAAGVLFSRMT